MAYSSPCDPIARNRRPGAGLLLGAVCLVVLLTACQIPGSIAPTVKIGLVAPFEGRYRYVGYDVIVAVRLALREANAGGGIGGFNVELVAYDDQADPAMAIEQANKLAIDPAVMAAIGHFRDRTTAAALDAYRQATMSLVAPAILDPSPATRSTAHPLGPTAESLARAMWQHAQETEPRAIGIITQGSPLGNALEQIAGPASIALLPQDDAWLEQALAADPDVILCAVDPVTAGEVTLALRQAGWTGDLLGGPDLAAGDFQSVAGPAAAGAGYVTPWPWPEDVPATGSFSTAYRAISNDVPPGPMALPAYEATWLVLEALREAIGRQGIPTREGVARALPSVRPTGVFVTDGTWREGPWYWYQITAQEEIRLEDRE